MKQSNPAKKKKAGKMQLYLTCPVENCRNLSTSYVLPELKKDLEDSLSP
jgi:hypothetical protein